MVARVNSKLARARRIYLDMLVSNPNVDRMEVVNRFVTDIPMKANSALTYWYMCQHSVTLPEVAPVRQPAFVEPEIVYTSPIVEKPSENVQPVVEVAALSAEEKVAAKRARDAARKREKRAQVRMMKQNASDLVEYVDVASL